MTLAQLCALLALSHGPAVERVPRPTIDRLGCRYLTRSIWLVEKDGSPDGVPLNHAGISLAPERWLNRGLDLTDPGTVNAVKVALALALGLDPGPLGMAASWQREGECWTLAAMDCQQATFEPADPAHGIKVNDVQTGLITWRCAPEVAAEPDSTRALVLAVEHVLSTSEHL